jgi:TRAP-type C4-dicarboxylate transport system permease small subunit
MYKCMLVSIGVMVEVSKEQHSLYANAILCNLLGSENSHVFRYLTLLVIFACLLCFVSFSYCYFILFLGCQWSPAKGGLGNSNKSATWDHFSRYIIIAAPLLYGYNDAH